MDDLIGFIIFAVIFILGPILEQMRKNKQPPPQQRKPPQRVVFEPQKPGQQQRVATPEDKAAAMVPDELWEMLTGAPKPKPRTVPAPLPPDVEEEELEDEEFEDEEEYVETVAAEATREEAVSLEELPRRYEPLVVSMETQPDPRARHAAFHRKIDEEVAVAESTAKAWIGSAQDLRRAFVLQTILDRPKGLD